jgi:hypothetical protein
MDRPPRRRHRYRLRSRPANAGLPQRLSRTIRVVLFGVEEMDFSGAAYARAHEAETGKIMVAAEADFGARNVYSVQLPPGGAGSDFGRTLQRIIAPLGANVEGRSALGGGEDIRDLQKAGPAGGITETRRTGLFRHPPQRGRRDLVDRTAEKHSVSPAAVQVRSTRKDGKVIACFLRARARAGSVRSSRRRGGSCPARNHATVAIAAFCQSGAGRDQKSWQSAADQAELSNDGTRHCSVRAIVVGAYSLFAIFGSSTSRNASPIRLTLKTVTARNTPGIKIKPGYS